MQKMLLRSVLLSLVLCFVQVHHMLGQLSIIGEVRPRAEYRNGFKTLSTDDTDPAFFVEQRSRIYAHYTHEQFKVGLTVQDVRIWGSTGQVYKEDPSLTNMAEAWGEYLFNEKISVKLGRQILTYDNDRILGSLDWAQQSRSHDLALLKFSDSTWQLHIGAAFNQDAQTPEYAKLSSTYYTGVSNYKTMQYLWFHKEIRSGNFSLLLLNNGVQTGPDSASSVAYSHTLGGIFQKKLGTIGFQIEAYQQFGENAGGKAINAQLLAVNAAIPVGKAKLTVGADYLSGTSHDESDIDHSFNPLYGTHHKFYGFMDYFYVGNAHTQNGRTTGLIDFYINPVFPISSRIKLITAIHQFVSPIEIYSQTGSDALFTGSTEKNLGTEIDLVLNLELAEMVNLQAGYSQLFATKALENLKKGDAAKLNNWAWLMISFKPKFL